MVSVLYILRGCDKIKYHKLMNAFLPKLDMELFRLSQYFIFFSFLPLIHATHFRGAIFMWEPTGNPNEASCVCY